MPAHHLMPSNSSCAGPAPVTEPDVEGNAIGSADDSGFATKLKLGLRRHQSLLQSASLEDLPGAVRNLEYLHPNRRLLFLAQSSPGDAPLVPSIYRGVTSSVDLEDRFDQLDYNARRLTRYLNSIGLPTGRLDDFQRWAILQASSGCGTPVIRLSCSIESAYNEACRATRIGRDHAAITNPRISVLAFPNLGGTILTSRQLRFDRIPRVFFDSLNLSGDATDVYVGRARRSSRFAASLLSLNDLSRYRVAQIRLPEGKPEPAGVPSDACLAIEAAERDGGKPDMFAAVETLL